jgi:hypothetical protein
VETTFEKKQPLTVGEPAAEEHTQTIVEVGIICQVRALRSRSGNVVFIHIQGMRFHLTVSVESPALCTIRAVELLLSIKAEVA